MLVLKDPLQKNISAILRMIRNVNAFFDAHGDISERQLQLISFRCAEMALLALAAADEIGVAKDPGERMLRGELSSALREIAIQAINVQEWESLENIKAYFAAMAKRGRFVANILKMPEEAPPRFREGVQDLVSAPRLTEKDALAVPGLPEENEAEKLRGEIRALREILTALVLERDNLLQVVCKEIEADYMRKLGHIEAEIYHTQCEARYLQRKLELMQAALNRRETIRSVKIEADLRGQYEEYQRNYEAFLRRVREAARATPGRKKRTPTGEGPVSGPAAQPDRESEEKQLKRLYRKIAKALHPDIHPDQDAASKELFQRAILAYKEGDRKTLTEIAGTIDGRPPADENQLLEALRTEKERLLAMIRSIRAEIKIVKSRYPYTKQEILNDPVKLAKEKERLSRRLNEAMQRADGYVKRIREMEARHGRFDT